MNITITITHDEARMLAKKSPEMKDRILSAFLGDGGSEPVKAVKAVKAPARVSAKPSRRSARATGESAVENASTVLAHMKSLTPYAAETLRAATGLDKPQLSKAVHVLLRESKIVRSGEKRGTRYTIATE